MAKVGDLIAGRYRLLRPVGAGAMGHVWAARHELLGKEFALKIAALPERTGPEARARFLAEAQTAARLRHPNIVDVGDVGEVSPGGELYLAMELLDGVSLAQRLTEAGSIEPAEALAIAAEIARGLAAAHEAGIVHRDVKPENVFLARAPTGGTIVKLLDFGVAHAEPGATRGDEGAARAGEPLLGTPAYMSPEQALGEAGIDRRTDVWSLGVVLYEMLTGRHPFVAPSYQGLLPRIAEEPYPPLPDAVPPAIQAVVARCLAKPKADRYPTAAALLEALDAARGGAETAGSVVRPKAALPSLPPASGREGGASGGDRSPRSAHGTLSPSLRPVGAAPRGRVLTLAATALALAVLIAWLAVGGSRPAPAPAPASTGGAAPQAPSAAAAEEPPSSSATAIAASASAATAGSTAPSASVAPGAGREGAASSAAPRAAPSGPGAVRSGSSATSRPRPVTGVNSAGF